MQLTIKGKPNEIPRLQEQVLLDTAFMVKVDNKDTKHLCCTDFGTMFMIK